MSEKNVLIIADDFTGANDTGIQLRKRGVAVEVVLFPPEDNADKSLVLDTESRTVAPETSANKVSSLLEPVLAESDFELIYKKVDSTIRGNIGAELKAVCDLYQPDKIVFAPAYPKINRTTENGIHHLNQVRLMETEMANDPLNPIWTDDLVELLAEAFDAKVKLHTAADLNDAFHLGDAFIHVVDATVDQHLDMLADKLLHTGEKILYVGSAGLAESLFQVLYPAQPVLAVVGSISEVSLEQIDYAEKQAKNIIAIDINDLVSDQLVKKYGKLLEKELMTGSDVILTLTRSRSDYTETIALFNSLGIEDKSEISRLIREAMANMVLYIVSRVKLSGVFMTGGDTAIEIIKQLGGTGSEIENEVSTGAVHSRLSGGKFAGLNLITKAGAFGESHTLVQSIDYLKGR